MALDRPHFLSVLSGEPASMIAAERLAADRLLDTPSTARPEAGSSPRT